MSFTRVIRYTTRPELAQANEDLIRDVFAELAVTQPLGLRYSSYRLADGVSFVHVAAVEGEENPLAASPAFAAFQQGIADRCVEGPVAVAATCMGSYG